MDGYQDRKLELRLGLGPPGEVGLKNGPKRAFQHIVGPKNGENPNPSCANPSFFKNPAIPGEIPAKIEDSAQHTDKKPNTFNERSMGCAPVVGWPPIRSSRKNLSGNSMPSKVVPETSKSIEKDATLGNLEKNRFVKINMEGIPIGRKVNLKAYNSYEELSIAIDQLFSGLLAVQGNSSATESKMEEPKIIEGSIAGNGEYTLVYEDDEGDRILVGDVPWNMFVSSARRLRVLKSSEIA